jgi:acetyl esterase/lipase
MRPLSLVSLVVLLATALSANGGAGNRAEAGSLALETRGARTLASLKQSLCSSRTRLQQTGRVADALQTAACRRAPSPVAFRPTAQTVSPGVQDGLLIGRQRLATAGGVAIDLLAYTSDALVVGGVACYPDDGQAHSTVIHVHGGTDGLFGSNQSMLNACVDWASLHGRTAFLPSLRGQDGSEGRLELCLGEAHDVAAGAIVVRSLAFTDPSRVALVGGSIGGCTALRAATRIPNLRAVVAFVPPTDWKGLVEFHRTRFTPATEQLCDGTSRDWTIGGPELADTFDRVICGHLSCSDADYEARSPLPEIFQQTAPTLIVAAGADNVVPVDQQILWSLFRSRVGYSVTVFVVDRCDPAGSPPAHQDVLVVVTGGFHLLSGGSISSGLTFLMTQLDG